MAKDSINNDKRQHVDIKSKLKQVDVGIKDGVFIYTKPLSVTEFASKIDKQPAEIIKYFFMRGKMFNVNSTLDDEQIGEFCLENNLDFKKEKEINHINILENIGNDLDIGKPLTKRAPIVTIMGHVDHGKTTLLDYIRKSHVAKGEFGGITQHIGAYQIVHNKNKITFLDTPGHAAFTQMRIHGANVTDIVVIVVAADDGIKPQTDEAIDHAKAAKVPIIVFINKIDKPGVNIEHIYSQLAAKDLTPDEWGGDTIVIKGSALTGVGVDKLIDAILTLSEVNDYKANFNRNANGTIIEAKVEKGLGPTATVIVKGGTLKLGDFIVAGKAFGKIKLLQDENGNQLKQVEPSQPAKIIGFQEIPEPGSHFIVDTDAKDIKEISDKLKIYNRDMYLNSNIKIQDEEDSNNKHVYIILKTDVAGSIPAITSLLNGIQIETVKLDIIRASVGEVTETDIQLARSSKPNAMIICFNTKAPNPIKKIADNYSIKILTYNIIYKLSEDIEKLLKGELKPEYVEQQTGVAIVRQLWSHSKVGKIAGCYVESGEINRNDYARVERNNVEICNTKLSSLKHVKDLVLKAPAKTECGITLNDFNDLEVGDIIKTYKLVVKQ